MVGMIKRGEVYQIKIIDAIGNEQKGDKWDNRVAVVVSNNQQNAKEKVIIVVPLSTSIKKILPFHVPTFFQGKPGKAKCEQIRTLTFERFGKRLGILTSEEMEEIEDELIMVLNLENYLKKKFKEWLLERNH